MSAVSESASRKPYAIEFTLPGLPKSPNSLLGAHWQVRAGHAKKWKRAVWRSVWPFKPAQPLVSAALCLTRVSSVRPDFDGLVGAFKPIIDGLVECGVLDNDTHTVIGVPTYLWEKGARGKGCVRVRVEEIKHTRPRAARRGGVMTPQYKAARDEKAEAVADSIDWKNLGDGAICYKPMAISMWRLGADFGYAQGQAETTLLEQELIARKLEIERWKTDYVAAIKIGASAASRAADAMKERDEWKQQAENLKTALMKAKWHVACGEAIQGTLDDLLIVDTALVEFMELDARKRGGGKK